MAAPKRGTYAAATVDEQPPAAIENHSQNQMVTTKVTKRDAK
jgi:hypothetical protein